MRHRWTIRGPAPRRRRADGWPPEPSATASRARIGRRYRETRIAASGLKGLQAKTRPKRGKARKGASPRGPFSALIEKRPPRARRPALPQPRAAVLSAKAGLTAGFGMGPGDPRLCGRARGGRSPAASLWSLPGTPHRGDPGGRMAGTDRRSRIALGAYHRGCEELGLLVPLG